MGLTAAERRVVLLIGAVNFINILDFMMVMPLGPDFARALAIPAAHIGFVGGAYTAAACLAGLAGSLFLDRFDRRRALAVSMLGLVTATALGGLALDMTTLIGARLLAGGFGGPAIAVAGAVIADSVAAERRGRAMGAVMGAFSLAAVLGVPIGLELARLGGWRLPFFAVAGLGFATIMAALALLPPQRGHLDAAAGPGAIRLAALFGRRQVWVAYGLAGLPLLQVFMIIPNISAYVQFNLGLPRARLGLLYLIGGGLSFFGMRLAGRLVDRCGATPVTLALTLLLSLVIYLGYVDYAPAIPVLALFPCFMLVSSGRMVATGSTLTKVAEPGERAGFMSVVSAVQNLASAAGSFLAAQLLTTAADGSLRRMPLVALISIAIGLAVPGLMAVLEGSLRRRVAAPMRAIDIA